MGFFLDSVVARGDPQASGIEPLGLLFPGQGAQSVGMGQDLFSKAPLARELFRRADALLGFSLSQICFSGPLETLTETRIAQPALFVAGLAVFEVLKGETEALLERVKGAAGLSLGEFSALAAAGCFSFEEGLRLVQVRGEAMQRAAEETAGGMVSLIGISLDQARAIAAETGVDVANINAPDQVVLSGEVAKLARVCERAEALGVKRALRLQVNGAFHSRLMRPAQQALAQAVERTAMKGPGFPVVSNVTGKPAESVQEIKDNLIRQIISPVEWVRSMQSLEALGARCFFELGPGRVLKGLAKRIAPALAVHSVSNLEDLNAVSSS